MEGCEATLSMAHPEYGFQVYSSVSASPCTTAIYGSASTTVVDAEWPDSSLTQAVQIEQLFSQVPYEHHHHQQHHHSFYIQQQYPQPTCSTPLSVASSGSNASDVDIFGSAEGEPLPLTGTIFSDVCSPTSTSRKTFSHHSSRHPKLRSRVSCGGRRRTAPVYPDKSVPIPLVKENRAPLCRKSSDTQAPSADADPGLHLVTDATADFVKLRSVLHSAAAAAARVPVRVELSHGLCREMEDIESELLKLQAEKAKLMKRAHEGSYMVVLPPSSPVSSPHSGVATLAVCRTGRADIDSPYLEEANHLLSAIGGLHQELASAIQKLVSFFTGGQAQQSTRMSDCLGRLQDLLPKSTKLALHQCSISGIYQIEDSSHGFSFPEEDIDHDATCRLLAAVNDVLKYAQFITLSDNTVKERLDTLLAEARQRSAPQHRFS